jgi:hypothetical protein
MARRSLREAIQRASIDFTPVPPSREGERWADADSQREYAQAWMLWACGLREAGGTQGVLNPYSQRLALAIQRQCRVRLSLDGVIL